MKEKNNDFLKGAAYVLDKLWYNSANERYMDKRVKEEILALFGANWTKDMYKFID